MSSLVLGTVHHSDRFRVWQVPSRLELPILGREGDWLPKRFGKKLSKGRAHAACGILVPQPGN